MLAVNLPILKLWKNSGGIYRPNYYTVHCDNKLNIKIVTESFTGKQFN